MSDVRDRITPRIQSKQGAFEGQAASAAPSITDDSARASRSTGQARPGLAAERNAGAPAPISRHEGGHHITLPSPTSDVSLPPYARRLDVRATRAAFAAGTLGTVGDNGTGVDEQRRVELRDADRHNADDVQHGGIMTHEGEPVGRVVNAWNHEVWRLAFLRRVQYVDPRERRA